MVGERQGNSTSPFGFIAVQVWAYASVGRAGQNGLKIVMVQTEAMQEENQYVRVHLVIHVAKVVTYDERISCCVS